MNSIKKLQEYIRGAKVIQTIETIGGKTVKTLKYGYYYPDYIETYEDKQKYELKCDVAILKIQYKNLNKKLEINDLIHFGLLLSIYCKKQFLSDDESTLFIEEIWKFVLEFINENQILVDKDIDRVNNEKFAMQGIFKYVKYKIDTGKIDSLKEACNYFASNKLRVNDQVTQFSDLLSKLIGRKANIAKATVGAKINYLKLNPKELAEYMNIEYAECEYPSSKIIIKHTYRDMRKLYNSYKIIMENDLFFKNYRIIFGYLINIIYDAKHYHIDSLKDLMSYDEATNDSIFKISNSYISLKNLIIAIDLFKNYVPKDDNLSFLGRWMLEWKEFCKERNIQDHSYGMDLNEHDRAKFNIEFNEWLTNKKIYKGYANYKKSEEEHFLDYELDTELLLTRIDNLVFNTPRPSTKIIDFVSISENKSYLIKTFRNTTISKGQYDYISKYKNEFSTKFLFLNFIPVS